MKLNKNKQLVIAAENGTNTSSGTDALALLVDPANFNVLWSQSTGLQGLDETFHDITQLNDGNYVATGNYTVSPGDLDIFVSKINDKGESCCLEPYDMEPKTDLILDKYFKEKVIVWNYIGYGTIKKWYVDELICPEETEQQKIESTDHSNLLSGTTGNIQIYPNPSNGKFTIYFTGQVPEKADVAIRDLSGRLIHQSNSTLVTNSSLEFDGTEFRNGVYLISVKSNNSTQYLKLTVNR